MDSPAPAPVGKMATTVLDHIAIAVETWSDAWPRYIHQLGGRWHSGGPNIGFSPAQLSFANGAKVEVLQPFEPEANPFLRRFLDHSGPGPHHLTFKVPDIEAVLEQVRGAGFEPVGVNLSDPQWREGFIHPRQATGVVVQVAQERFEWISPSPEGFPTAPATPAASLLRVTHAVRDLDTALGLFRVLLGGVVTRRGVGADGTWEHVDLAWPGPLALRLVAPTPDADHTAAVRTWLGDRTGRVHHLAFAIPEPTGGEGPGQTGDGSGIPGVLPGERFLELVTPAENLGTGIVLVAT